MKFFKTFKVFENKKDAAAELAAEYVDEFFSPQEAAKFLKNVSTEELNFEEFVEYLDDYYLNATKYFDEAELKSQYYKAIVSAYENDIKEYFDAYTKAFHPWKESDKLVKANDKIGLLEKFSLNSENYVTPLFYQISKIDNGFRLTFGLSQDLSVAKRLKTSVDLTNVDEKFVDTMINTIRKFLQDKPDFANTAKLKEMVLKIYNENK